jgi:hypothetical protein
MCTVSAITEFVMKKVRKGEKFGRGRREGGWKDTGIRVIALLSRFGQAIGGWHVFRQVVHFSTVIDPSQLLSGGRGRRVGSGQQRVGFVIFDLLVGDGGFRVRQHRIARETERGQRRAGHVEARHVHEGFLGGFSRQRDRHDGPREVDCGGSGAGGGRVQRGAGVRHFARRAWLAAWLAVARVTLS